jgi:hypothetical protein
VAHGFSTVWLVLMNKLMGYCISAIWLVLYNKSMGYCISAVSLFCNINSSFFPVCFQTSLLEDKLSSAHNTINILQHTVADKEADLKLATNSNKVCFKSCLN